MDISLNSFFIIVQVAHLLTHDGTNLRAIIKKMLFSLAEKKAYQRFSLRGQKRGNDIQKEAFDQTALYRVIRRKWISFHK